MNPHNLLADEKDPSPPSRETPDAPHHEPSLRTMKTDVAGYIQKEKPSLINIISRRQDEEPLPQKERRGPSILSILATGVTVALFAMFGYAGYVYYHATHIIVDPGSITIKFFSTDKTGTHALKQDRAQLLKILQDESSERERDGLVKGLSLSFENSLTTQEITPHQFFSLTGILVPKELLAGLDIHFLPFLYYTHEQSFLGVVLRVDNTDKAFAQMLSWERSIQKDLTPLYLGRTPDVTIPLFEDKTYRNVHYRFVQLAPQSDFGIGYFVFPTKSYLIITTSEEELKVVMNRLFEA